MASDIAIALHTEPHRNISLALLAKAVGATKHGAPVEKPLRLNLRLSRSSRRSKGTPEAEVTTTHVRIEDVQPWLKRRVDTQKRLAAVLASEFPNAPEELPDSRPSLTLGQRVSSGTSLGEDVTEGGGDLNYEVQVGMPPRELSNAYPEAAEEDLAI